MVQVGERDKVHKDCADFRVLRFPDATNASAAKNYAVQQTDSPWLLFLDAGVEPIEADWVTKLWLNMCSGPRSGAVGARLINPIGTIEHAGLVLGVNGVAQSAFHGFPAERSGVNRQLRMVRNYSAVSGACMLTRRDVFQQIGGFDETLSHEFAEIDRKNAARRLSDCLRPICEASLECARTRKA